jgi:hypothetical protein
MALIAGTTPDGTCYPASFQGALELMAQYLSVPSADLPIVFNGSAPANTDSIWYDTTDSKNPVRKIYINGAWRRDWSVPIGEVRMFSIPTAGLVDGTGKGTTGLSFEGWAVCNGNNGTPNMLSSDGYGWQGRSPMAASGSVALGGTGGKSLHILSTAEMPAHYHLSGTVNPVQAGGGATMISQSGGSQFYTQYEGGNAAHNNLHPYIGLNFLMYIGYATY